MIHFLGVFCIKKQEIANIVINLPLFGNGNPELVLRCAEGGKTASFKTGDNIFVIDSQKKELGIIIRGKAKVFSSDTERQVVLRTLTVGDMFGVSTLFGGSDTEVSRIEAASPCSVLFISENELGALLEADKSIMYNYIRFLTSRICFLQSRIACFTAGSAERRLALYLYSLREEQGMGVSVTPSVPLNTLSEMLDIGRASLYRAIDCLTDDGFIKKDGKSFILTSPDEMLKKYNK